MKELEGILTDLKLCLKNKRDEFNEKDSVSSYITSQLDNVERELKVFEDYIRKVTNDLTLKNKVIRHFQEQAKKIKEQINAIK